MERERPLLNPFLALAVGLYVSDYSGIVLPISSVAIVFCCLLLSCCVRNRIPFAVVSFLFFLIWGMYALNPWKDTSQPTYGMRQYANRTPLVVEGIVSSRPVAISSASGMSGSFILR